jgi:hypothetical protein
MLKVPKFRKASGAAAWIAKTITARRWTTGYMALSREGYLVDVSSPKAHKFCALGWVEKANQGHEEKVRNAVKKYMKVNGLGRSILDYNDQDAKGYKNIQKLFVGAAKILRAKERGA